MNIIDYLPEIEEIVDKALSEDLGHGDVTTDALIPSNKQVKASITSKSKGILAGIEICKLVFLKVDPFIKFTIVIGDGILIQPGTTIATIEGAAQSILKAERTALNFLQHLSGIATVTSQYVEAVKGLHTQILDTRKTIPGLRTLEKYAVATGGGKNHRFHLGETILIKDNHIALLRQQGLDIKDVVMKARSRAPTGIKVEIETTDPEDAFEAFEAGADIIMLDNMNLDEMRRAAKLINHRAIVEASGGVNLDNVRSIAETGVDWISIGALTHSARALDISLELEI